MHTQHKTRKRHMHLVVPATGLSRVPRWLFLVVRCQEWCDVDISEEVTQPRASWQMVDSLCSLSLPISPFKPPIRTTGWATATVGVLVMRELGMFTVDECHTVVWACFYLYNTTFAHFFEEFLGQGKTTRVVFRWEEQKEQLVHSFGRCIRDLYMTHIVEPWACEWTMY